MDPEAVSPVSIGAVGVESTRREWYSSTMNPQTLFELLDAHPFRPFEIDLTSGRRIRVDHPENVIIVPGRHKISHIEVYHPENEKIDLTWANGIAGFRVVA